jgi:hypothetical protein
MFNPRLFELPLAEIKEYGQSNLTYGSLSESGMKSLADQIQTLMKGSIFGFDLGCGDGELIYHLQNLVDSSEWEGVEISEHRISMQSRDVCIWQGDMLLESLHPYNVLHADNLCLDDSIADSLEEKIACEFTGLYISYRTPQNLKFLKRSRRIKTVITETTWTRHPIHYYKVNE